MLCYVTHSYGARYGALHYVTLQCTLCYTQTILLRYVMLCHITLCYAMLRYGMLCYVMLRHTMS